MTGPAGKTRWATPSPRVSDSTRARGEPIVGLKSFILSPFVDEEHVELVVQKVLEARERVGPS